MLRSAVVLGLTLCAVLEVGCARTSEPVRGVASRADVHLAPEIESIAGRVPNHSTLATLLESSRLRADLVPAIVSLTRTVFDPRRLKADHTFRVERTLAGLVRRFEYEIDEDRYLRVLGPSNRQPEELTVELVPYRKERALVSVRGEISKMSPSLFTAMEDTGEGPDLSIELADIFGGEIDFHSDLQPGDGFSLTFEKVYREGQFSSYGAVLAAEFTNDGRVLKAVRYAVPGGKPAYYDGQGRSLKRFFLKSPLKFAAPVSSRFANARMHPILRIVRPHFGVDYQAPAGSPVVAVANGTVVSAGWSGEAGRLVHVRHSSGYETLYMHLSSIAVRAGQHVGQGELIGRVGMTGLATGPHLDYRVKRNGGYLNPLVVHRSLPPGDPIPAAFLAQFEAERDRVMALLVPASGQLTVGSRARLEP
ncbi:MAG TPA: M23 family metallopeptidase [Vicinamibacterales bacterium]